MPLRGGAGAESTAVAFPSCSYVVWSWSRYHRDVSTTLPQLTLATPRHASLRHVTPGAGVHCLIPRQQTVLCSKQYFSSLKSGSNLLASLSHPVAIGIKLARCASSEGDVSCWCVYVSCTPPASSPLVVGCPLVAGTGTCG